VGFLHFLKRLFGGGSANARAGRDEGGRGGGETTPGGSKVLRHRERTRPVQLVPPTSPSAEEIEKHVETHVGPIAHVFHEIVSELVHLDVLLVAPRPERPYWTLVTSGMSDLPMKVPRGLDTLKHAELVLCLPPSWPTTMEGLRLDRNYWPILWLKNLARLPHTFDTWLGDGHTIPNGDPAEALDASVGFAGWLVTLPRRFDADFLVLPLSRKKAVHFYAAFPVYPDEMDVKLAEGAERLNELLDAAGVTELVDPQRASVAAK
jgi:hypothetical protein